MKKILTFFLLATSIQLFSANYRVVQKKGVTLSQQEVDRNNREIEIAAKRDYDLIMRASSEGSKSMISRMMEGQLQLPMADQNNFSKFQGKMKDFYNEMLDTIMKKNKIDIIKIRYVTNDVAEVTLDVKTLDMTKGMQNYLNSINQDLFTENELNKIKNLSQEQRFDKTITKMFDSMRKAFEGTGEYASTKWTIYLEKDNGKWAVAELDEKIKNFREMYQTIK